MSTEYGDLVQIQENTNQKNSEYENFHVVRTFGENFRERFVIHLRNIYFNPFQPSLAFHMQISHLILKRKINDWFTKEMNTELK